MRRTKSVDWGCENDSVPIKDQLRLLRNGSWYPMGIPPRQTEIIEPFSRTEDVLRLITELLRLELQQGGVSIVVANPPFNILMHKKGLYPEKDAKSLLKEAEREAHLIGLKDQAFYRAALDQVVFGNDWTAEISRIPVFLMSELTAHPLFKKIYREVWNIFKDPGNTEFREAVYDCVPKQLRPHGQEDKTYADLKALDDKSALTEARNRIRYAFYQIAIVLMLGGEKLGHPGEEVYNAVTERARNLMEEKMRLPALRFKTLPVPEARGTVPYRAVSGPAARRTPGALTSAFDIQPSGSELATSVPLTETLAAREKALGTVHLRAQRNADLWQRTCGHIIDDLDDRRVQETILEPFFDQELRDRLLQVTHKDFFPLERFLLKRSGIRSVVEGEQPEKYISAESRRWLPFLCSPPKPGMFFEGRLHIQAIAYTLLYRSDEESCPLHPTMVLPGTINTHRAIWTTDFLKFRAGVFSTTDHLHLRWRELEKLFQVIEGTRFERAYGSWLVDLTGRTDVHASTLAQFKEPSNLSESVSKVLRNPVFNNSFRDFLQKDGA